MSSPTPAPTDFPFEYQTSDRVSYVHGFYHYRGNDDFDMENMGYRYALLFLGGTVIFVGLIFLVQYFVFLCCRSSAPLCRKEAICGPNLSRILLVVISIFMLTLMSCSYVGYNTFSSGMDGVVGSSKEFTATLESLLSTSTSLQSKGSTLISKAATAACSSSTLDDNADLVKSSAVDYKAALPEQKYTEEYTETFENDIPNYVYYVLGTSEAVAAAICFFTIFGAVCKSSTLFNLASLLSVLLFLLIVVLVGIELTLSVMFADFCAYGPNRAIQDKAYSIMSDEKVEVLTYYMTCSGTNALATLADAAETAIGTIKATLANYATNGEVCSSASALEDMNTTAWGASELVANLVEEQKCSELNAVYADLIDESLCGDTLDGLLQLWASHLAAGALLYVTMFFTSHVKQKCKLLNLMDEEGAVKAIPIGPPLAP